MINTLKKAGIILLTIGTLLSAGFPIQKAAAASGWINASQTSFDGNSATTNTAYITWGVSDLGANGRGVVYVRANNGQEQLFGYQDTCSGQNCPAPWINPNDGQTAVYTFTLYNFDCVTGQVGDRLASVNITVTPRGGSTGGGGTTTPPTNATGNITASPNPCTINSGASECNSVITWNTANVTGDVQVWVKAVSRTTGQVLSSEQLFQSWESGSANAPWIGEDNAVFTLYEIKNGTRSQLSQVTVYGVRQGGGGGTVTPPANGTGNITANPNPCTINSGSDTCTSYINWSTSNVSGARVFVTERDTQNGIVYYNDVAFSGNQLSATGQMAPAPWIRLNRSYTFVLYALDGAGNRGAELSRVVVTAIGGTVINPGNPTLTISPSSQSVIEGNTTSYTASYDSDGPTGSAQPQNVTAAANWSSGNLSVASSLGGGQFRGVQAGYTQVAAVYAGLSASAALTVTAQVCTTNCGGSVLTATTVAATNVTQTSATLNGTVNASGISGASYRFEYGLSPYFGAATNFQNVSDNQNVSAPISGLAANTTYYFRIVAMSNNGSNVAGQTLSFTTSGGGGCVFNCGGAVQAVTTPATNVTQSSAILNGSVNPANNSGVSYYFAYGTNSNNLSQYTAYQPVGSGNNMQNVSVPIGNLTPNTTYYFRVVAAFNSQTVQGTILSFTTSQQQSQAPIVTTLAATNISQTSATVNGNVDMNGTGVYYFQYGTDPNNLTLSSGSTNLFGNDPQSVYATISGLSANTTYYFRVVANNGQTAQGSVLSFITGSNNQNLAPTATTLAATNVAANSATVNGTVNPNGSATTWRFEWGTGLSLGNTISGFQNAGSGSSVQNVFDYLSALQCNTTYYYRLVAQNVYGTSNGSILSFTTNSCGGTQSALNVQTNSATNISQTSATLNGQVMQQTSGSFWGNGSVQVWFEYGINSNGMSYMTASQNLSIGSSWTNFSQSASNLQPNTTYYFRAVANNSNGTVYGQTLSFTTSGGNNCYYGNCNNYGTQPTVVTLPTSGNSQNSAVLLGIVNPNNGLTTAWFEYGQSLTLGLRTFDQPVGSGNYQQQMSYPVSGLQPNTTYYYRAVAQNQSGIAYGQVLSFTTQGNGYIYNPVYPQPQPIPYPVYQPVVQQIPIQVPVYQYQTQVINRQVTTNTGVNTGTNVSCVALVPMLNVTQLKANQEFIYTVTYHNGCNFDLSNAALQIALPVEVDFISASNPYFTREGNALTFNLGNLPMNAEAAVNVHGTVKSTVKPGDNLIFGAIFNFNDVKGRFQSIVAYLTAFIIEGDGTGLGTGFGANIGDALGIFFGSGWFTFLLLVLILVVVLWMILNRTRSTTVVTDSSGLRNLRVE